MLAAKMECEEPKDNELMRDHELSFCFVGSIHTPLLTFRGSIISVKVTFYCKS